jgi:hypothetical protein
LAAFQTLIAQDNGEWAISPSPERESKGEVIHKTGMLYSFSEIKTTVKPVLAAIGQNVSTSRTENRLLNPNLMNVVCMNSMMLEKFGRNSKGTSCCESALWSMRDEAALGQTLNET